VRVLLYTKKKKKDERVATATVGGWNNDAGDAALTIGEINA
jgi:hypothetical protein